MNCAMFRWIFNAIIHFHFLFFFGSDWTTMKALNRNFTFYHNSSSKANIMWYKIKSCSLIKKIFEDTSYKMVGNCFWTSGMGPVWYEFINLEFFFRSKVYSLDKWRNPNITNVDAKTLYEAKKNVYNASIHIHFIATTTINFIVCHVMIKSL